MPKPGFKSFSLKEDIYNELFSKYGKNKETLKKKGINSFSAYLISILNESIKNIILPESTFFEKIFHDETSIAIKDKKKNKIIEISISKGKLFCNQDNSNSCIHIGFAYSLPEVLKLMKI